MGRSTQELISSCNKQVLNQLIHSNRSTSFQQGVKVQCPSRRSVAELGEWLKEEDFTNEVVRIFEGTIYLVFLTLNRFAMSNFGLFFTQLVLCFVV